MPPNNRSDFSAGYDSMAIAGGGFHSDSPQFDLYTVPSHTPTQSALSLLQDLEVSSASDEASEASGTEQDGDQLEEQASGVERLELPIVNGPACILVTGGAGFIGAATAHVLLERGDRVVLVDEMNEYYDVTIKQRRVDSLLKAGGDNVVFYNTDFCDKAVMGQIFETEAIDIVCHLGARAGVRPSIVDPDIYIHSNITGTVTLLELAVKHNIKNFVYASSSSVYGGSTKDVFRESDVIVNQCSQYAATKASCELLAHTYHHLYDLNVTGLRFFTVYGPSGRPDMAPYKFIDRIHRGITIDRYGDGTSERDYTFIDDIVDGVVRSCDRQLGCAVINLGNGNPVVLRDFIDIVQELLQKKATINVMPDQPGDVPRTCADVSVARQLLGYNPKTSLRDGLRKTVQWYQRDVAPRLAAAAAVQPTLAPAAVAAAAAPAVDAGLVVGFRIHRKNDQSDASATLGHLAARLATFGQYAARAVVAVDSADTELCRDVERVAAAVPGVTVVPVAWGRFVPALNAIVANAAANGMERVLFQSNEVDALPAAVAALVAELVADKEGGLVAGAALPGHSYEHGARALIGTTMPWNTLAVWDVAKLSRTGFLMVSEGVGTDGQGAGAEEGAVVALQQRLHGANRAMAKLVHVPGLSWQTSFEDAGRKQWHEHKMASKVSRVSAQCKALGLPAATVLHC